MDYCRTASTQASLALTLVAILIGTKASRVFVSTTPTALLQRPKAEWYVFLLLEAVDRSLGNKEGWADLKWKTPDQGVATHVYAAFDPNLKGMKRVTLSPCEHILEDTDIEPDRS